MSPKRAKKRPAKKRAAKNAARKAPAKKRAPKRASAKPRAAKKAARRPAKKAARRPSRAVAPRTRATLRLVMKPKPARKAKPAPPKPFAGATAGASAKDLALFELVRARVGVQAAIQGMSSASAEAPVAEGKWSPRQIVLHLYYWDREMLPWIEKAYLHGQRPPHTKEQILAENHASQHDLGDHDWDDARRLMQQTREAFLEALQSVPEEPAEMWSSEHALGWLVRILSHHDRHHADVLKEARGRGASS